MFREEAFDKGAVGVNVDDSFPKKARLSKRILVKIPDLNVCAGKGLVVV